MQRAPYPDTLSNLQVAKSFDLVNIVLLNIKSKDLAEILCFSKLAKYVIVSMMYSFC
jgi:hypothetical protein